MEITHGQARPSVNWSFCSGFNIVEHRPKSNFGDQVFGGIVSVSMKCDGLWKVITEPGTKTLVRGDVQKKSTNLLQLAIFGDPSIHISSFSGVQGSPASDLAI